MGSIKGVNVDSKMTSLEKVSEKVVNDTTNSIKKNVEVMDLDLFELDTSKAASMSMIGGNKFYGHKDFDTLEELELKKKKKLDDIDKFENLKALDLDNCDLKESSDLGLIPDSIENISFINCDIDDYSYLNDKNNLETITIEMNDCGIDLDQFSNSNVRTFTLIGVNGDVEGNLWDMKYLTDVEISYTNIDNVDAIAGNRNLKRVTLEYNLLSDISDLYGLDLEYLDIEGNSVNNLDITRFPYLKQIRVKGNYNLYTQELLDYCRMHDISIDIDQNDVNEINQVRDIIKSLDLDNKTDIEKERIIYDYVIKNMEYDEDITIESNEEPIKTALNGKGVCAAYAAFFKALCNCAGINAYNSTGIGDKGLFDPGGMHAWNIVEIDGQYYLCDPTWSDGIRDGMIADDNVFYKIKKLFHNLFSDDDLPLDDQYYNVYGKKAKKFIKKHKESTGLMRYGKTKRDVLDRDEKALNVVEVDTSTADGQTIAIDTAMASAVPGFSGIKSISNTLVNKIIDSFSGNEN